MSFLLVLWLNRLPLMHEDLREIPVDMQSYISSPSISLPSFSLDIKEKLALTNDWFVDKWTFVYFTHGHCLPACQPSLEKMNELQAAFANSDFQFLAVGIDSEHETVDELAQFLDSNSLKLTAATASSDEIDTLARSFIALFLQTNFSDGSYQIEQEHHIFLVDPKGRVYATFKPPYSSATIRAKFLKLRYFYAKTE
ncbi:MAG: redoxin domain-containing protein [Methylophaga sp.]|nr:redoxin domain-containing protein [Methylophaga sp.]